MGREQTYEAAGVSIAKADAVVERLRSAVASTRERGALRACGADLAAHCINDVITTGADPLFLLDYVAANRIDLEEVAELVDGFVDVCREAGCARIGGETAELPGIYREDELDFAGTCVGVVARDALIDGSAIAAGDVVVGLPSAGACSRPRTTRETTCSRRRGSTWQTYAGCAPPRPASPM